MLSEKFIVLDLLNNVKYMHGSFFMPQCAKNQILFQLFNLKLLISQTLSVTCETVCTLQRYQMS